MRWDFCLKMESTIDQSESSETDLSVNIYAATRKMVNYALRIPDGQKRWETLQPIGEGRY